MRVVKKRSVNGAGDSKQEEEKILEQRKTHIFKKRKNSHYCTLFSFGFFSVKELIIILTASTKNYLLCDDNTIFLEVLSSDDDLALT